MSSLMIPLCGQWSLDFDFLAGASPAERESTAIIYPSETTARIQDGGNGRPWKYQVETMNPGMWDSVVYDARSRMLKTGGHLELIVVVDASSAAKAPEFLRMLAQVDQDLPIHILLLADVRSEYAEAQQALFQMIRNDVNGDAEDSGLTWFTFTLLADETMDGASGERVRAMRRQAIPYVLRKNRTNDPLHGCFSYAIDSLTLEFDKLEELAQAQATRFVCRKLEQKDLSFNEMAVLLMNGDAYPREIKNQQEILMNKLLACLPLHPVMGVDLLVRKHDPKADGAGSSLLERVLADNPVLDARSYDAAEQEGELEKLPYVNQAVRHWEEHVLAQAKEHTGLEKLAEMLMPSGEWDRRISKEFREDYYHHEDPLTLCSGRLPGRAGYTEEAAASVQTNLDNVYRHLQRAIFQACLRLMHHRLHLVYDQVRAIHKARMEAIRAALEALEPLAMMEELTTSWCQEVQRRCDDAAGALSFCFEPGVLPEETIRRYRETVYERTRSQLLPEQGAQELADHADDAVRRIQNGANASPLLMQGLWNTVQGGHVAWYADPRLAPTLAACGVTEQPVVLRLTGFFMELNQSSLLTEQLFRGKVIDLGTTALPEKKPVASVLRNRAPQEAEEHDREEYLPYRGRIEFYWQVPEADFATVRYCRAGTAEPLMEEHVPHHKMVGASYTPEVQLPAGTRLDVYVAFQGYGISSAEPLVLRYQTAPSVLSVALETVTEGMLFKKRSYVRLRVSGADENVLSCAVLVNADNGCICRDIAWTQEGMDYVSEVLPESGSWTIAPDVNSPYAFSLA